MRNCLPCWLQSQGQTQSTETCITGRWGMNHTPTDPTSI
uniref:Uncharacterized protein n=1 Tax=Rhizophora mucronata TaxID=61149 RepID=A0A2P2NFC2_RHIMU